MLVPKGPVATPVSARAWAEKTGLGNGAPHTWLEASSVLALKDVAGDPGSLMAGGGGLRETSVTGLHPTGWVSELGVYTE